MPQPSHTPCPMCGKSDANDRQEFIYRRMEEAVNNLKFLNLGFSLSYFMTDLERQVYYHHQIRKCKFSEIADLLKKSESTIYRAWKRCKSRGDKVLEDLTY